MKYPLHYPRSTSIHFDEKQIKEIIRYREYNLSLCRIAKIFGTHPTTIKRILDKFGGYLLSF